MGEDENKPNLLLIEEPKKVIKYEGREYTLNDPIFKYGLVRGNEAEIIFPNNRKLMVVGGAAVQLISKDSPELLRPTNDIDFIVNNSTSKSDRRAWAEYLSKKMNSEGHSCEGNLSRFGSGVRFTGLKRDFLLHLDCFGPNFYNKHEKRLTAEFERSELEEVDGGTVRRQSPMDVILNKLRRMKSLESTLKVGLDSPRREFLRVLEEGGLDDLDVQGIERMFSDVDDTRNKNIEALSRLGYREIEEQINLYKIEKDIYDVSLLLGACRSKGIKIPQKDYRSALKLALL